MKEINQSVLRIPQSVKQDTVNYRQEVQKFLKGEISEVAFRAYRVPMGVYEQRQRGKYMDRIRIGAGLVTPFQLQRIAELCVLLAIHGARCRCFYVVRLRRMATLAIMGGGNEGEDHDTGCRAVSGARH